MSDSSENNYSTLIEKYEADRRARDREGKGVRLGSNLDEIESVKVKASKTEASTVSEYETK